MDRHCGAHPRLHFPRSKQPCALCPPLLCVLFNSLLALVGRQTHLCRNSDTSGSCCLSSHHSKQQSLGFNPQHRKNMNKQQEKSIGEKLVCTAALEQGFAGKLFAKCFLMSQGEVGTAAPPPTPVLCPAGILTHPPLCEDPSV